MRRWIAVLIALALIPAGTAMASRWGEGELAVVDPATGEVTYPYRMENIGGGDIFDRIDSLNDEAKLVEEHGSLTIRMDSLDIDGEVCSTFYQTLFDTEFGKAILLYDEGYDMRWYSFADRTAVLKGDDVTVGGPSFPDKFEDAWANSCYPVASGEVLHAMATGTDGFTYMRTTGMFDEEGPDELEYRLGDDMRLHWVKLYTPDEDGEPGLWMIITYSVGDPVELPDSVVKALREA